jgi:hypothetical protein
LRVFVGRAVYSWLRCAALIRMGNGWVAESQEREPHDPGHCSHLHMVSLPFVQIGDAGARDLGAALLVNTTLTDLG